MFVPTIETRHRKGGGREIEVCLDSMSQLPPCIKIDIFFFICH